MSYSCRGGGRIVEFSIKSKFEISECFFMGFRINMLINLLNEFKLFLAILKINSLYLK